MLHRFSSKCKKLFFWVYFKISGSFSKEMSYLCGRKWKYIHKEREVDCKLAMVVLVTPSGSPTPRTTHTYTPHPTQPNPNTSPQGCLCSFLLFHHFDLDLPSFTKLTLYMISNHTDLDINVSLRMTNQEILSFVIDTKPVFQLVTFQHYCTQQQVPHTLLTVQILIQNNDVIQGCPQTLKTLALLVYKNTTINWKSD